MAGGLLGDSFDDPKTLATLQLAASLLGPGSLGQNASRGLLGYQQSLGAAEDRETQKQYRQAQSRALAGEDQLRQAKIQQMQQGQSLVSGLLGGGGVGGMAAPQGASASADPVAQLQRPEVISKLTAEQVVALENSGLKGIREVWQELRPKWQNVGGNLVNTNDAGFQGGIVDQVQLGPDGRSTILRANGGNPVMGAVPGSLQTYGAFKDIDNRTSAAYSPGRPVLGADGRQYGQSQLQEIGGAAPRMPAPISGAAGPTNAGERGMAAQVADVPYSVRNEIAAVQRGLASGEYSNPRDRAQAVQYLSDLQRQASASPMQPSQPAPSAAAGALDFSPAEKAAQAAQQARLTDTAKADVVRDTTSRDKTRNATENLSNADRAMELLRQGPTGSGVGAALDRSMAVFGRTTQGGNIAAQLDIVSANMVKNVPRFEGPQSNIDVEGYKAAAGRVADRSLPVDQRLAAAGEVKRYEQKALAQNGGAASGGQAPASRATLRFNPATGKLEAAN